ncbi:MAG: competence/damage-inducible protein A [Proteobacteria bacterium]|jgi:FAD synthetase|nr:competence/damage-inducible protein A [Pseudomonadota bacterium]
MTTAAAIIIGDEILSGKFADENGPYLITRLRELGVDLRRLVIISDKVNDVAREVAHCSESCDYVFTTGGVGPTHDDITLQGVAAAFDVDLVVDPTLVGLLKKYGMELNSAALRMATVPKGSRLLSVDSHYPILQFRNVYVFPGIPKLFRTKFEAVAPELTGEKVQTARIYTNEVETLIAARLEEVADLFPLVAIGSYPRLGESQYKVIVTLESRTPGDLQLAYEALCRLLSVVDVL